MSPRHALTIAGISVLLGACATSKPERPPPPPPLCRADPSQRPPSSTPGFHHVRPLTVMRNSKTTRINGVIVDRVTGEKVAGARVILQCDCDRPESEVATNTDGIYNFYDLPAGIYRVTVVHRTYEATKRVIVLPVATYRVNFAVDALRACRDGETPLH